MDYYDSIKRDHCVVSFSPARSVYYICLWNGVLRDGKVDDVDIQLHEAANPKIINRSLVYSNHSISLTETQFARLSTLL